MKRPISPCRDCVDGRTVEPNCHDTCEPYLIWKIEQAEYSKFVAEEMKKNTDMERQTKRRIMCINNGSLK